LDFSETSLAAEQQAEALARATGAALVFAHVVDDTPFMLVDSAAYLPPSALEQYEAVARQHLDARVEEAKKTGFAVGGQLLRGRPDQGILNAAQELGVDLIVMGTHGRSGVRHLLLGSVAERVVRSAPIPVMTVRAPVARS